VAIVSALVVDGMGGRHGPIACRLLTAGFMQTRLRDISWKFLLGDQHTDVGPDLQSLREYQAAGILPQEDATSIAGHAISSTTTAALVTRTNVDIDLLDMTQ